MSTIGVFLSALLQVYACFLFSYSETPELILLDLFKEIYIMENLFVFVCTNKSKVK
jgi:hypothetical protein